MAWYVVTTQLGSYACAEQLTQHSRLRHGVTLRDALEEPFNQSFSVDDDWQAVRCNRRIACALFDFEIDALVMPAQVHGAMVARVDERHRSSGALDPHNAIPDADALITDTPNLLLGITIADCLPLFVLDPTHEVIGIAHSGWRGTAGRIAPIMLQQMASEFGTDPGECLTAIGPGIGPEDYEVDRVVHDAFTPEETAWPDVFFPTRPDHWSLDLTACVIHQLISCGVDRSRIAVSPWRTNRDPDLFFSHRLSPRCPRMGAFIGLRPAT